MQGPWGLVAFILLLVLDLIIAVSYFRRGDYPMALIWSSYAVSVTGFLWHWSITSAGH